MKKFIVFLLAVFLVSLPGMAFAAGSTPHARDGSYRVSYDSTTTSTQPAINVAEPHPVYYPEPYPIDSIEPYPVDPVPPHPVDGRLPYPVDIILPYPGDVTPVYPVVPAYPGYDSSGGVEYPDSGASNGSDIAVPPLEPGQVNGGMPVPERTLPPDIEYQNPEQPVTGSIVPVGNADDANSASRSNAASNSPVLTQGKKGSAQEFAESTALGFVLNRKALVLYYAAGAAVIVLVALVVAVILKRKKSNPSTGK